MSSLTRFAWLSIGTAVATIALKTAAYFLTGSVGLLSDALESLLNLITAFTALFVLIVAARPADDDHAYGHTKVEYFAAGLVGALILLASVTIAWTAIQRLLMPVPLQDLGPGIAVSLLAGVLNLGVSRLLSKAGRQFESLTLQSEAKHLMVDVWTSAGVILGVAAVWVTGWQLLDPLIAILVAGNILHSGWQLVSRAVHGLMDASLPIGEQDLIRAVLDKYSEADFHAVRTRQAGARRFVSMHILVPGNWSVAKAHELAEMVESDLRAALVRLHVSTHVEPREDPRSYADLELDR